MFDTLLGLIVLLISAAITTAIIRRLLLGVGWVRSFLVSLVVFSVSVPVTNWAATALGILSPDGKLGVDGGVALLFMVLVFLWVFVLSLAALVVLELIIPSGAVPGPIEAVQGIRLWVRRNRRYLYLAWIVSSSGLGRALRRGPESRTARSSDHRR